MSHDFRVIVQCGAAPATDIVAQCRACGRVRHSYTYATFERVLTTSRDFVRGEPSPLTDECETPEPT